MSVACDAVERVRRPEYTGENRCVPCTATNLAITAVGAVLLALLWVPLAVGFAVVALASIWLRGYLVPGTPELTKRYFPEWLLATFDKTPAPEPITDDDLDPEATLVDAGVLEPCERVDDLCLTDDFADAWREGMTGLADDDALRSDLAEHLDLDVEDVTFDDYGDAFVARNDGVNMGQWESRSALLADLAAARELPHRVDDWAALTPRARSQLLGGLRVFVETCPACGGAVTADEETVESCCRSRTVVGVGCADCGDRLLEVPYDEAAA